MDEFDGVGVVLSKNENVLSENESVVEERMWFERVRSVKCIENEWNRLNSLIGIGTMIY